MIIPILENIEWFIGAILAVFEILGVLSSLDAVMAARTSQGAIAWSVSLITFPYLAVPLYWIFGRSKFHGYVKARDSKGLKINYIIKQMRDQAIKKKVICKTRSQVEKALVELGGMPFTGYNDAELLINGKVTFESIFDGIDSAKDYILIQFFIVYNDDLGKALKAKLIKKAEEGVRVFFLYDEVGCHKLPSRYLKELRKKGVTANAFGTTKGFKNRFQLNFRNHRKIVIIDGHTAFVGGHNVGDAYVGKSRRFGMWRDTHVKVQGPSVQCVQFSFVEDWFWATDSVPELNWVPQPSINDNKKMMVFASGPADNLDTCGLMFTHAFNSAKKRVWISSPYFVPDSPVISALQLAALRGVDVRILLPEKPDHYLVYLASFSYYESTLPFGIKIYRYQPGFLHQKAMLVDDNASAIGTANLDNRSFRLNFEITMLLLDHETANDVKKMFEEDFSNSRQVTMEGFNKRPVWFKILVRFSRLLAPIL